jgi:hypothetical protein
VKRPLKPGVFGHASFEIFDGARVGRLRLDRWWDPTLELAYGRPCDDRYRPLVIIGINPSDADGESDDNTSAKGTVYARREGANGLVIVNLDCRISTDPDEVANVPLPYGADERHWDAVDGALSEDAIAVVAAWGKPPRGLSSYRDRVARVKDIASDVGRTLMCFGTNGDGSPKHPLYLPNATPLRPWWTPP